MIDLTQIKKYKRFVVQCHDNPDADALACAYAFSEYLKAHGKETKIVYSGFKPIVKSSLILMIEEFKIDITYIPRDGIGPDYLMEPDSLLVIVDGQYKAGNVKKLEATSVAVIDHHTPETAPTLFYDIRPFLGSCATLIWVLLKNWGFKFDKYIKISTALYYGLYSDTSGLTEVNHPLDMDMRDNLKYDKAVFKKLKNCNLSLNDLTIAGKSLMVSCVDQENKSAIFHAESCDPNVLGVISDLALQVDTVESCVVFCEVSGGIKLSVRSCVKEIMAYDLAESLCEGGGSGGGHASKAGGYISMEYINKSGLTPTDFLLTRYSEYFRRYDLIHCGAYKADLNTFDEYVKLKIPIGFVRTTDIFPEGTEIIVRTLEGDTNIVSNCDIYIMVGIRQEIYPIKREKFERSYEELPGVYKPIPELLLDKHYEPTVKNRMEGVSEKIDKFIYPCVSKGESRIYAKKLEKATKVFTPWNPEGYMFGKNGDYLAISGNDNNDIYIIENAIFQLTYKKTS